MMLQIIFSDNDWLDNTFKLAFVKYSKTQTLSLSCQSGTEQNTHPILQFTRLLPGYCTDLTPCAHVQADVNSRVEWVALNYFDVTAKVGFAHVVFTVVI